MVSFRCRLPEFLTRSGINREERLSSDVPFFLAELRRRTFAMIYHLDKSVSIWHECPVRMPRSGSDTRMPLDLHDDDLLVDGESQISAARVKLSLDGWNWSASRNYHTSAWARIRYLLGPIREQISEYAFFPKPLSGEHIQRLEDLAVKCRDVWKSLPSHLQYATSCWESNLSRGVCTMLALVHLNYLQLIFHVNRMLYTGSERGEIPLLEASLTLLTTVLELGAVPNRRVFVRHEYDFVVYAITSKRGTVIRQLSVFVSRLDTVFTPDNANHKIASEVSLAITQVLDQVLHAEQGTPDSSHDRQFPTAHVRYVPSVRGAAISAASQGNSPAVHTRAQEPNIFSGTFDQQGLDDWMVHIDWTAMGDEPYPIHGKALIPLAACGAEWFSAHVMTVFSRSHICFHVCKECGIEPDVQHRVYRGRTTHLNRVLLLTSFCFGRHCRRLDLGSGRQYN
nr:hypothetical protein CFP56_33432 [Quercus suber]